MDETARATTARARRARSGQRGPQSDTDTAERAIIDRADGRWHGAFRGTIRYALIWFERAPDGIRVRLSVEHGSTFGDGWKEVKPGVMQRFVTIEDLPAELARLGQVLSGGETTHSSRPTR